MTKIKTKSKSSIPKKTKSRTEEKRSSIEGENSSEKKHEKHYNKDQLKKFYESMTGEVLTITNTDAVKTLEFLKETSKKKKKTVLEGKFEYCLNTNIDTPHLVPLDATTLVLRNIRKCILKQEWDRLPFLIRLLMKHPAKYSSYVKEVSYLNFLVNTNRHDLLEEFFQLCFAHVSNHKALKEFDVWFRTD